MGVPATEMKLQELVASRSYRAIAVELIRLENERGLISFSDLSSYPEETLDQHSEVEIEYDTSVSRGCSVFGYYQPRIGEKSAIVIHPSLTSERDSFTIVHEFGHHVQRQHLDWSSVLASMTRTESKRLEERIADAFAAEVLIPASATQYESLAATSIRDVYEQVRASRAAVAMRAIEIAPESERVAVIVADRSGVVTFARASSDDVYTPARGVIQPGLARLILDAEKSLDGHISGELTEGVQFSSGWAQQELVADIALDRSGAYVFAVVRSAQRFGQVPVWERVDIECPSEACGSVYTADQSDSSCSTCSVARCPDCNRCACDLPGPTVCESCWMALSEAEKADSSVHTCD